MGSKIVRCCLLAFAGDKSARSFPPAAHPRRAFLEFLEGASTMNDAWRYCENLDNPEAPRALAGAALTAYLTLSAYREGKFRETEIDWGFVLRELREALAVAGHPAGAD
jgi:hypothetical protein